MLITVIPVKISAGLMSLPTSDAYVSFVTIACMGAEDFFSPLRRSKLKCSGAGTFRLPSTGKLNVRHYHPGVVN